LYKNHTTHHTQKKEHQQNYKATLAILQQVDPYLTTVNTWKCSFIKQWAKSGSFYS